MNLIIHNSHNGRTTEYTPAQLMIDARRLVKSNKKGRLVRAFVRVDDKHGGPALVACYLTREGVAGSITIAI